MDKDLAYVGYEDRTRDFLEEEDLIQIYAILVQQLKVVYPINFQ